MPLVIAERRKNKCGRCDFTPSLDIVRARRMYYLTSVCRNCRGHLLDRPLSSDMRYFYETTDIRAYFPLHPTNSAVLQAAQM